MLSRRRPVATMFSCEDTYEVELEEVERRVPHAPSRFALTDLNPGLSTVSSASSPKTPLSSATSKEKENQNPIPTSYTIDFGDKTHDLIAPPAASTPPKASDASIAPFLDAAKNATTLLTRAQALKAAAAEKRAVAKAARDKKTSKRSKRADERRMTGRVIAKGAAPVVVPKDKVEEDTRPKGDDPKYEAMLQDDLADPHPFHARFVPKWAIKSYKTDVAGMAEEEKAANVTLVKEAHKAGDKYCDVKGLLIPIEGVKYYRDNCPSEKIKPKGCDPRFTKFSPADFHGPAYYGAYFEEPEEIVDPVVQDKKIPKRAKVMTSDGEKPAQEDEATNSGPALSGDGVPTYCISTPFAFRYFK